MTTNHTPGSVVIDAQIPVIATDRFTPCGLQILDNQMGNGDAVLWRGRLIAVKILAQERERAVSEAAPELLAALEQITRTPALSNGALLMQDIARAALARAKGEA